MTPQELKSSILQLAIQGKLVEQRPEEGTGEEIIQKLLPYHKNLKPCKDELNFSAMDFDIPKTWDMVELNQLFDFVDYRGKTPHKIKQGVFLITASNIKQAYMDYTRKEYISRKEYEERQSRGLTQKGDLLFTTEAPMGNAALCDLDECSCGQRIITFKEYTKETALPALFMYFILSPQFQQQLLDNCTGTTAKGIKADKLKHFLLPLPPYEEQKRIVAKIEELLPYIDRYEKAWSRLEDFNKRFPVDMQKSILQMAIKGKLVEQRPEEGTGEELYQLIQAEKQKLIKEGKIKKEKPLPEITEDEIPFDIPESWKWCRLNDISLMIGDIDHKMPPTVETNGIPYISPLNFTKDGGIDYDGAKHISLDDFLQLSKKCAPSKNDIIFPRYGTIGIVRIVEKDQPFLVSYSCCTIKNLKNDLMLYKYVFYVLKSQLIQNEINRYINKTTQPNVGLQSIKRFLFPLPPLAEQKRIVAKLEEILPLCERLK